MWLLYTKICDVKRNSNKLNSKKFAKKDKQIKGVK